MTRVSTPLTMQCQVDSPKDWAVEISKLPICPVLVMDQTQLELEVSLHPTQISKTCLINKDIIVDLSSEYSFGQFTVQRVIFTKDVDKLLVIPVALREFFSKWATV